MNIQPCVRKYFQGRCLMSVLTRHKTTLQWTVTEAFAEELSSSKSVWSLVFLRWSATRRSAYLLLFEEEAISERKCSSPALPIRWLELFQLLEVEGPRTTVHCLAGYSSSSAWLPSDRVSSHEWVLLSFLQKERQRPLTSSNEINTITKPGWATAMNRFLCDPNGLMLNSSAAYQMTEKLTHLSIYFLPVMAFAGNALILLVVLSNAQLNRSSFSVYVKCMAISDTFVLLFKFLSYENKTSPYFYFSSMCTGLVFLSDASVLLSVWTIVLITIERTLVVIWPLHIKKFISASRARLSIIAIALLSLLFSARLLFIPIDNSPSQKKRCHPVDSWRAYRQLNATITEFAYCFVPLTLVIVGNCVTLYTVKRAVFRRREIVSNQLHLEKKRRMQVHENQLMLMLFVVTLMFIVYFVPFTISNIILRWGLPFGFCFTQESFKNYLILRSFSELLKDFNFCTNFIIYCISGRRFRYALCSLCDCCQHRLFGVSPAQQQESTKQRSDRLLQMNLIKSSRVIAKPTIEERQF